MANSPKKIDALAATSADVPYVGGGGPVLLEPNAVVPAGGNFAGETLTISGLLAGDQIGFAAGVSVTGCTIKIGNNKVATFTGGTNGQDLVITFGRGVVAHDVEALLRNLTYSNTGADPVTHTLSIAFAGTVHTDVVTIGNANHAPVVDLDSAATGTSAVLSYIENGAPKAIVPSALVSDADSADFNGGSLTVAFAANGTSADQLTIGSQGNGAGQIGISGSTISYGGTVIGTFSGGTNGADLNIAFTSNSATPAAVQALLRDILFSNSSEDPSTAARTVTYTLNDGDGTANGGHNIGTASATISVTSVNDAPIGVIDMGSATEKGGTANASGGADATGNVLANDTDVDNAIASLSVSAIRTGTPSGSGNSGTVGTALTGAHGSLTVNADGSYTYTVHENDGAVQALNAGGTLFDHFTYSVSDSGGLSGTAELVITINGADDAPVTNPITLTSIVEDSGARLITQAELLADVSDVDNASFTATGLSIQSGAGSLVDNHDGTWTYTPAAHDHGLITFSYDVSDGTLATATTASLDITPLQNSTGTTINLTDPVSGLPGPTTAHWSSDGTKLFLVSTATLSADDTDGGAGTDVFAVDLATGARTLLTPSIAGGFEGDSWVEATSPDGTKLVLGSTSPLTADDTSPDSNADFYLVDLTTGTKTLLTAPVAGGIHGESSFGGWSPDGSKLLIHSTSMLTSDDTDGGSWDVFVDTTTGVKTLLTPSVPGGAEGFFSPSSWSLDGIKLVIESQASLTADDTDGGNGSDLFLVDASTGAKTLLTAPLAGGVEGSSSFAAWSPDGTHFAFTSSATLTADTPNDGAGAWQVFVADLAGNTTLLSAPLAGGYNGDSEFVGWSPTGATALISSPSDLTANDTDNGVGTDLFAVDIATGTKTLLTQSVPGGAEGDSSLESWSSNGATLIVWSNSALTADDTDGGDYDLYAINLATQAKLLLTAPVAGGAEGQSRVAGWSPDGTQMLLASTATLTADDTDGNGWDLFSVDVATGAKKLLTGSVPGGAEGDSDFVLDTSHGGTPLWSADGHSVHIISSSTLADTDTDNGGFDLYWIDTTTGAQTFTDIGADADPGQTAWAEAGIGGSTLVGLASGGTEFLLVI